MEKNKEKIKNTSQGNIKEKKDTAEKEFVSYPDIATDVINTLLYQGEKVIDQSNLLPGPTETIYQGFERLRSQYEDLCKYEMVDGVINSVYLIANQTKTDGKMLLRKAGYIGGVYREQYENKVQNVFPVVEFVLYWGKPRWRSDRTIHKLFRRRKLSANTWKYIDEIKLHVFEMRHLSKEVRERFKSDMRIVVDFLAEGVLYQSDRKIVHKAALIKMIKVLSGEEITDGDIEKWMEECEIKEEDEITVCELFDQYERKGRSEGIIKGKIDSIFELLEDYGEIPRKLQEKIGGEKDLAVLKHWLKTAAKVDSIEEFQSAM